MAGGIGVDDRCTDHGRADLRTPFEFEIDVAGGVSRIVSDHGDGVELLGSAVEVLLPRSVEVGVGEQVGDVGVGLERTTARRRESQRDEKQAQPESKAQTHPIAAAGHWPPKHTTETTDWKRLAARWCEQSNFCIPDFQPDNGFLL